MNYYIHYLLLFVASAIAGAVNAVAGGGTLLTFPALQAAGFASKAANATSTVALWPGQWGSLWGFRDTMRRIPFLPLLCSIGIVGGAAGAWLLFLTPQSVFDHIVPFLVLLATILFAVQKPRAKTVTNTADGTPNAEVSPVAPLTLTLPVALFLLIVAVYGGYFGAGIGILTLAALGFLGMTDLHEMNGVKAAFTLGINGVAALLFVFKGLVDWKIAAWMAVGSLAGGYFGAGIAKRIGQQNVRRIVIAIGFCLAASLLFKR